MRYFRIAASLIALAIASSCYGSGGVDSVSGISHHLEKHILNLRNEAEVSIRTAANLSGLVRELSALEGGASVIIWTGDSLLYWSDHSLLLRREDPSVKSAEIRQNAFMAYFAEVMDWKQTKIPQELTIQLNIPLRFVEAESQKAFMQRYFPSDMLTTYLVKPGPLESGWDSGPGFLHSAIQVLDSRQNSSHAQVKGWFWLMLFHSIIILLFVFSGRVKRRFGDFWGTLLVISSALTIRIISVQAIFADHINTIGLFSEAHFNETFNSSIGDLFLNTLLFLVIGTFLLSNLYNAEIKPGPFYKKFILTIANYSVMIFGTQLLAFVIKNLLLEANIPIHLERIFAMGLGTTMITISLLMFVIGLFFLNYLLIHNISKRGISKESRIAALLFSGLITLPVFFVLQLNISPFAFYLLVFAYIVLKDVFSDSQNISISWLVIWIIFVSGSMALLLFKYNQDAIERQQVETAREVAQWSFRMPQDPDKFDPGIRPQSNGFKVGIYESMVLVEGDPGEYANRYEFDTVPPIGRFCKIATLHTNQLIYRSSPGHVIVVGKNKVSFTNSTSLFSFVFTLLVLIMVGLLALNSRFRFLPGKWAFIHRNRPSLRRRIQVVNFSLLILSFATICVFTIYFFRDSTRRDANEERNASLIRTRSYIQNSPSILEKLHQPGEGSFQINSLGLIAGSEIFFYDRFGQMESSTGIGGNRYAVPRRIPHHLFLDIKRKRNVSDVIYDPISPQCISMAFASVHTDKQLAGIIGIPVMDEGSGASESLNDFLGTLLNMYIFMLIIAGSISLAFADSITRPLSKLSEKFKGFKLGATNDPIEWESRDELGALISDYNRMIVEVDESARLLAITEREMAWREMAKQIAHEIKNPLTPMKLSIQHLKYAIRKHSDDIESLVDRVSDTLVEQIDNLAQIASEFSNFAHMPKPENEKVILNDVLASVHDLFRKRDDMDISLYVPIDEIYVFADRNHLIRVLINLLKNAIQAIPQGKRGQIDMQVYKKGEDAIIKISDNGVGIPDEFKDKVFKPNFTSKSSGTGLGLAICANIVEGCNGKLYFTTEVDKGTQFFVQIPLMHMEDNFSEAERVSL